MAQIRNAKTISYLLTTPKQKHRILISSTTKHEYNYRQEPVKK